MKVDVKSVEKTIVRGDKKTIVKIPYLLWIALDENSDICKSVRRKILQGFGYDEEMTSKAGLVHEWEKNTK